MPGFLKDGIMEKLIQFEVGKTYETRSIGDYDCIFSYTIVKRTAKQITFMRHGKPITKGVKIHENIEYCYPEGNYSMCPVIHANKEKI